MSSRSGFTLLEVLVVTLVLGIAAAVAIPSFTSIGGERLDLAATEVADALRFARGEALRTGQPYGVSADVATQRVRVYWLDKSGFLPVLRYTVRHPLDKRLYDLSLGADPLLSGVTLAEATFLFQGSPTPVRMLGFGPDGTPKYDSGFTVSLLQSAVLRLSQGSDERTIRVEPITGRVTVQ
jgi:prepilin-type N-terminal cleavage/methylation domain-containing protein